MKLAGFAKYLALQIPEAVILGIVVFWARDWLGLPLWGAFAVLVAWLLKDLAMYPLFRKSLEDDVIDRVGVGRLIGQRGVAEDELAPGGYVRVKGELWQAELGVATGAVSKGSPVRVHAVRGLTLLVEPVSARDA